MFPAFFLKFFFCVFRAVFVTDEAAYMKCGDIFSNRVLFCWISVFFSELEANMIQLEMTIFKMFRRINHSFAENKWNLWKRDASPANVCICVWRREKYIFEGDDVNKLKKERIYFNSRRGGIRGWCVWMGWSHRWRSGWGMCRNWRRIQSRWVNLKNK